MKQPRNGAALAAALRGAALPVRSVHELTPATDAGVSITDNIDVQIAGIGYGPTVAYLVNTWVDAEQATYHAGPFRDVAEVIAYLRRKIPARGV